MVEIINARMQGILILLSISALTQCAIQQESPSENVDGSSSHNNYWLDDPQRHDSNEVRYGWRLIIHPSPGNAARTIVKRIDEVLNLTCTAEYFDDGVNNVTSDLTKDQLFKLTWHLPIMPQNSKNRVSFVDFHNSKSLIVDHLKESDTGEYECQAKALSDSDNSATFMESVTIRVKPRKGTCTESSFMCSTGECIAKRFICDGLPDCKDRSDESYETCGTYHPCDGKLKCEDARCIPAHYCCDRTVDKNCSTWVVPSCCKQLKQIQIHLDMAQYPPQHQTYSDLNVLQTTIYTIIGCAMAFMFIVTIMVVAICRVHLKRTAMAHPQMRGYHGATTQTHDSFGNIFFNSAGGLPYTSAASGLLVTYNINNGVQFMGRPLQPPPYSELVRIPPREGPPPPYCSVENLALDAASSNPSADQDPPPPPPPLPISQSPNSNVIIASTSTSPPPTATDGRSDRRVASRIRGREVPTTSSPPLNPPEDPEESDELSAAVPLLQRDNIEVSERPSESSTAAESPSTNLVETQEGEGQAEESKSPGDTPANESEATNG